jgi:hypothetical protein
MTHNVGIILTRILELIVNKIRLCQKSKSKEWQMTHQ